MAGLASVQLPPLPSIKDLLRLYRLRALRQLSQNFLLDSGVTNKIVRAAGKISGGYVCEIGPGPGSITRSIINASPAKVIVLEKDKRFTPTLEMLASMSPVPVEIILGNVLSYNMKNTFPIEEKKSWGESPPNIHLIGNLPFNVASPMIIKWLQAVSERDSAWSFGRVRMTLTFQKEVAERMVAPVLTKERCRLSVMVQNWCTVNHKFTIPGKAFIPKPEVDVGVVHLVPRIDPVIELPFKMVEKVVRCVFSYRQKYCRRCVGNLFPPSSREAFSEKLLKMAEIPPTSRPFQLTVPEIGRICYAYKSIISDYPQLEKYNFRSDPDFCLEDDPTDEPFAVRTL